MELHPYMVQVVAVEAALMQLVEVVLVELMRVMVDLGPLVTGQQMV
jgi:hypothetical protein